MKSQRTKQKIKKIFFIGIELIYSVLWLCVSDVQQSESVMHSHIFTLF